MSHSFEQIPSTTDNRQFPGGDIDERQEMAGMQLYDSLVSGDEDRQMVQLANLRRSEIGQWRSTQQQEPVYKSMGLLAEKWGQIYLDDIEFLPNQEEASIGQGHRIVALGLFYMLAFVRRSHLFPTTFSPYIADELVHMTRFDSDRIRLLAGNAWSQMHASHVRIYQTIAPFKRHVSTLMHLREDERVLLNAAAALPYLLATTSRMDNYMTSAIEDRNVDRTIAQLRKG